MTCGNILFLNGASSSGKTTIALELQKQLPEPFIHWSFDHFRNAGMLPMDRIRSGEFKWAEMREAVFDAFHRSLRAMAEAGCNVLAEHIIETEAWRATLQGLLGEIDVFIVAVRCPLDELERRERQRGDRPIGDALRDAATCYGFCKHDFEVDSSLPADENAQLIIQSWLSRDVCKLSRFRAIQV
jgi:chloramphenicol 3-O phosphotransferase